MKFGLPDTTIENMQKVFEANAKVDEVVVFGSRAKGNYKEGSDIDLAVKGTNINFDYILKLHGQLDELNLPYKIDLLDYATIKEPALVEHIDRVGIIFYERWKKYKLEEITEPIKNTYTPNGNGDYKYIGLENIEAETLRISSIGTSSDVISNKFLFKANDVLFGKLRPYFRKVVQPKFDGVCSTDIWVFRKKDKVDANFLFYFLANWNFVNTADGGEGGTKMPRADWSFLKTTEWNLPPIKEQKEIAQVFSSLDDKIDLLQRQNKTLEQLAETLFRQWFVEEADESWEVGKIDDVVSVKGGTTPSTTNPEYWNGEIHWTLPRDLSNNDSIFIFDTERKISEKGLAQIGSGLLPVGTVLLSSRAPIGYLTITEIPVAINQGYIAIICDKIISNYFIFLWCKANMHDIENAANGSVFQEISKSSFKGLDIFIPSKEKLKLFDKKIEALFQKIKTNTIQIKQLTKLRDALLPKLMSGEVRVN